MSFARGVQSRKVRWLAVVAALVVLAGPGHVPAEEGQSEPVLRVEEDWLLWVGQPSGPIYSPQFHTVMSPFGHTDSYFFQVTWNYRELPEFMPGGFQVQSWNDDVDLDTQNINSNELSRNAEVITWTQVLETNGTQLGFSVTDGMSSSWGQFGHPDTTIVHDGSLQDLSGYSTDTTVANSWITFGQNRVNLLKITAVRYYGADGQPLWEDTTDRVVYVFKAK
jgi:hypothetical protein